MLHSNRTAIGIRGTAVYLGLTWKLAIRFNLCVLYVCLSLCGLFQMLLITFFIMID